MADEIRWVTLPDTYLQPRLRMPEPTVVFFVAAVDVLAYLDEPDRLRDALELLLARHAEHTA